MGFDVLATVNIAGKERKSHWLRELRSLAEAAEIGIVSVLDRVECLIENFLVQRRAAGAELGRA